MELQNGITLGEKTFYNMTSHDVTWMTEGMKLTFKPSGVVARMNSHLVRTTMDFKMLDGLAELSIPIHEYSDASLYGLPEPKEGVIYITSYIVAKQVRRLDVISPMTNETAIRDEQGNVLGVKTFQRFS